jgi:hypothetical protein
MSHKTALENEDGETTFRSEILNYERVTLEEWESANEAVRKNCDGEVLTKLGNQHRIELLDGGHQDLPEAGYFEDDETGIKFILTHLEDPTWETLMWAASMHCGGTFDQDIFEAVIRGEL